MPAPKIVAIMPAYNASKTLEQTFREIPQGSVQECIVVDDVSADSTVEVARKLGLRVFLHRENQGYGGNQKTCYVEALKTGADIVVMLHPDYQYDPKKIPDIVRPIVEGRADLVLGSRMAYARRGRHAVLQTALESFPHLVREQSFRASTLRISHRLSRFSPKSSRNHAVSS